MTTSFLLIDCVNPDRESCAVVSFLRAVRLPVVQVLTVYCHNVDAAHDFEALIMIQRIVDNVLLLRNDKLT